MKTMKTKLLTLNHITLQLHNLELLCNSHSTLIHEGLYHQYLNFLAHRWVHEGERKMIQINKDVRLCVTRFIAGNPWSVPFLKSDKDSLPKALGPLRDFVRSGDDQKIRYVLSILAMTKGMKLPIKPDLTVIERKPDIKPGWDPEKFKEFLRVQTMFKPGWLKIKSEEKDLAFLTTKSGPNGQALVTSLLDLSLMPESLAEYLYELAPNYMERVLPLYSLGMKRVCKLIVDIGAKLPNLPKFRKLAYIQDKEGKTRIIAIGDYFSQAVLRPIHNQQMKYLETLSQDMTSNQRGHPRTFGSPEQHYHSLDLKAATDRFPLTVQKMVMEFISGSARDTDIWGKIMTSYPFIAGDSEVMYGTGQPMGLYSSWTTFAITHHFIVAYSAWLVGMDKFLDYILLGDDIVLKNDVVAESYRSVLDSLGVEISSAKTLVSKDTFEFAKKLYRSGTDLSPIPGWSLTLSNSSTELAGALSEIFKDYKIEPSPESVSLLIGLVCGNRSKQIKLLGSARRLVPLLVNFPMAFEGIGSREIISQKLSKFLEIIFPNLPCWNVTIKETLLSILIADLMDEKYLPEFRKMLKVYTSAEEALGVFFQKDCSDQDPQSLSAIPIVAVLRQLTRSLEKTSEQVFSSWLWDSNNPIPFRNLGIVDPSKLTQDREHLKILGLRADFTLGLKRRGKAITQQTILTPDWIHKKWIAVMSELEDWV